jgi:hypothetical protein
MISVTNPCIVQDDEGEWISTAKNTCVAKVLCSDHNRAEEMDKSDVFDFLVTLNKPVSDGWTNHL